MNHFFIMLYTLVIILNINEDDTEEKLYGILINFIRKLIDFFFTIISENHLQNFPLTVFFLEKMAKLTCLYGTMYLHTTEVAL